MRSDEVVELAGTMYDAHDLNAAGQDPVKDQVVANRKQAEIRSDVGAGATEVRMISEQDAPLVEVLKDAIRSVWVVRSDVEPNVYQVVLGFGGAAQYRHGAPPLPSHRAAARSSGGGPAP